MRSLSEAIANARAHLSEKSADPAEDDRRKGLLTDLDDKAKRMIVTVNKRQNARKSSRTDNVFDGTQFECQGTRV